MRDFRISPYAKDKIVKDFMPEFIDVDVESNVGKTDSQVALLHAGALCLYAASLITKVQEGNIDDLPPKCAGRKKALTGLVKVNPKYVSLDNAQIEQFVNNLIIRDIRNCFAHGNFELKKVGSKTLEFVLKPARKDFVSDEPIVISADKLLQVNHECVRQLSKKYIPVANGGVEALAHENIDQMVKGFILPVQLLKLADYYIGGKSIDKKKVTPEAGVKPLVLYSLMATKITYEQDDYYDLFGKDSNIFGAISLIRNSLAHDTLELAGMMQNISYTDRGRTLMESVAESLSKLSIVDSMKQGVCAVRGKHSDESVTKLTEKLKETFDFFFGGKYAFDDLANAWNEEERK